MDARDAPDRGGVHSWVRNNVLGLIAIFIALSGTAVATQVVTKQGAQTAAKKKAKPGPRGPAGPQGLAGPQGPAGPQGLTGPSTGQAGGDLTGNYPNPSLAVMPAARATTPGDSAVDCTVFGQTISNGTDTTVIWLGEDFDTATMHTTTSCPTPSPVASRLTVPRAGLYEVDAGIKWGLTGPADNAVGERFVGLQVNDLNFVAGSRIKAVSGNGAGQTVSTLVALSAGDYVEVVVFQDSGGNVALDNQESRNFLAAHWVGPAS